MRDKIFILPMAYCSYCSYCFCMMIAALFITLGAINFYSTKPEWKYIAIPVLCLGIVIGTVFALAIALECGWCDEICCCRPMRSSASSSSIDSNKAMGIPEPVVFHIDKEANIV